jgi:hypothetical protein
MSRLDPDQRRQIEEVLQRGLTSEELAEVASPSEMTEAHQRVARTLAGQQAVLCSFYLRAVTSASISAVKKIIDEMSAGSGEH